jgi:SAM-dependent methyltransferase
MVAFLIQFTDPKQQEYVQKNPFLIGPDVALNRWLREAWYDHLETRSLPRAPFTHEGIDMPLNALVCQGVSDDDRRAIADICAQLAVDEEEARRIINVWGWKIARAPRTARRILSIGCGSGHELLILRALFPEAELQGVDYEVKVPAEWRKVLRLGDLQSGSIEEYLVGHQHTFDLVFSNHTLEHMSAPDRTLRLACEALVSGGSCLSALPVEADNSNPFFEDFLAVAEGRGRPDPQLDLELINPGHAWKTNREDLAATFHASGFCDIQMFTRVNYPAYHQPPLHVSSIRSRRVVGKVLERATLGALRRGLRQVFPGELPYIVVKTYYSLAARCWFSRLRLIHNLMHEVVVLATTDSERIQPS